MNIDHDLIAEIEGQLADDILHFAWLSQIVCQNNPLCTEAECAKTVVDLVSQLHQTGTVIVGNARPSSGMVLLDPWPESGLELRARMEAAIADTNQQDRDYCFWIQLAEHAAR